MNFFSRKCICKKCNRTMKFKRERSSGKYICSTYDVKGKDFCERLIVDESFFMELIERRYSKSFDKSEIQKMVDKIEISDKYQFIIYFYNDDPIVSMNGCFRF